MPKILATGTNLEKFKKLKSEFENIQTFPFSLNDHDKINHIEIVIQNLKVDILVNNGGINADNLSLRLKEEDWKAINELTSSFMLCKFAIKNVKNKSGKIVNITSIVGHTENVGQANYSIKSRYHGYSKSLSIEYVKKY